jgi:hypothetical protein
VRIVIPNQVDVLAVACDPSEVLRLYLVKLDSDEIVVAPAIVVSPKLKKLCFWISRQIPTIGTELGGRGRWLWPTIRIARIVSTAFAIDEALNSLLNSRRRPEEGPPKAIPGSGYPLAFLTPFPIFQLLRGTFTQPMSTPKHLPTNPTKSRGEDSLTARDSSSIYDLSVRFPPRCDARSGAQGCAPHDRIGRRRRRSTPRIVPQVATLRVRGSRAAGCLTWWQPSLPPGASSIHREPTAFLMLVGKFQRR